VVLVDDTKMETTEVVGKNEDLGDALKTGIERSDFPDAKKKFLIAMLPQFHACDGKWQTWEAINSEENYSKVLVAPSSYPTALAYLADHIKLRIDACTDHTSWILAHPVLIVDEVDKMHTKPADFNDPPDTPLKLFNAALITSMCSVHVGLSGVLSRRVFKPSNLSWTVQFLCDILWMCPEPTLHAAHAAHAAHSARSKSSVENKR